MENASRALVMAAGLLIGLLILSLAVYLFANFGSASAETHRQNAEIQINQFNVQFTAYQSRTDITIYDIITVANLARNTNEEYDLTSQTSSNYYVNVNARTNSGYVYGLQTFSSEDLDNLVKNDLNSMVDTTDPDTGVTYKTLPTYSCDVTINNNTQRVSNVTFTIN